MARYHTKELLYNEIHKYKAGLGLEHFEYGFNMVNLCISNGIKLEKLHFKTKALRGLASIGDNPKDDIILLNTDRDYREQNLDCGHEYVHLCIHRNIGQRIFNCIDAVYAKQDTFIEWQANEGAAEMLVPYSALLPYTKTFYNQLDSAAKIIKFKENAALAFNVTVKVIEYRLESLKYEIHQYINGIPIIDIKILSLAQQDSLNIRIKSLNDLQKELFENDMKKVRNSYFINFSCI
jgi:Zn-dependent peptidase ImmA (M78 family)